MALRKTRWNPATKTTWLNSLHAWLAVLLGSSRVSDGEAARRMGKTACYQTKPPATLQGNLHLNSVAHDRQREKCSFTRALTSTGVKNALKSFALLTSSFTRYPVYYMCSQVSGPTNSNFNNWKRKSYAKRLKEQRYWISLHPTMYNVHVVIFKIKSLLRFNQNFGCQGSKNVLSCILGLSC